jgi:serine/threonine protein kinase
MGEVYRAHDTKLNRDVAIKVLPQAFADDRDRLARFEREAQVLAALNHPNIAHIHGLEESSSGPALIMELVEGPTLADLMIDAPRGLPIDDVVAVAAQIAGALDAAHTRGIVHRDLKPANIKITPAGTVKVLDFGLAKISEEPDLAQSDQITLFGTREGAVIGTVKYMSPEQARGEALDARTDLFSLGLVLYEMATGRPPFDGTVATLVTDAILHATPASPRGINPLVPVRLERMILRLLEKECARRYQSAADVRADVKDLEHDLLHMRAPSDRVWQRRLWQRRPIQVALAAVLIIGVTFGTWLWSHAPTKPIAGPAQYEQITYFAASATSPSLSPDGRMMTFIQGTQWFEGLGQVYVKALPDGEPVQLTHDRLEKMSPTFSPDGSRIVYTVARPPGLWDAWTVPVIGGEPRLWLKNTATPSWLPDKRIMFSEITSGLHMRVVTSTESRDDIRPVYTPRHEQGMAHWSHLSPDGAHVLIVEMEESVWRPCRVVPFDGSSVGQRVGADAQCISAAWSRDGKWVFTSSLTNGTFHIWRQRFPDGTPEQITSGPTEEEGIATAPDGASLLASVGSSQQSVWLHDDRGERALSTEGYAFIPRLPAALVQPFSADGNTLFYLARRGGVRSVGPFERSGELWRTDLESGRSEVVVPGFDIVAYDVSREMTQVVFAAIDKGGQSHIWLARLDRQLPPRQLSAIVSDSPRFGTSDEIFSRVTEGNAALSFVYRTKLDSSEPQKVVATPVLFFMSASPDGAWVTAQMPGSVGRAGDTLAFPTAGGMPVTVCANCSAGWTAGGKALVVTIGGGDPPITQTIVLALEPGRMLPRLPAMGIRSVADLAGLSVLSSVQGSLSPGAKPQQYAFGRVATQRNIYRVPLP